MFASYHLVCEFPGCGHTALMKQTFDFPIAPPPDPELPRGWSIVIRQLGEETDTLAICDRHDFSFDGVKASEIKSVGFIKNEERSAA